MTNISYQNTDKNRFDEKIPYKNPNLFSGKEFGRIAQLRSSDAPTQKRRMFCSMSQFEENIRDGECFKKSI
jgi:hypothetical protein